MNEDLEIRTLGGLAVTCAGNLLRTFKSRKVEALLVYLASTGRDHPRDVLAEMFWPGRSQSQAMANLRPALNNLRQHVAPYVVITRDTAGMNPASRYWVDAADFEARLDAVDRLQGSQPLEDALNLYRGDFLEGFYVDSADFEDWATLERERLRFRMIAATDRLIACYLEQADYTAGIGQATRILQLDPLREESHRQLMLLLTLSGQRSAALAQYQTCCRVLMDELGVEPTSETTTLYERIRTGQAVPAVISSHKIRGYELRDRIGAGGFGEVYLAYQPAISREVAVKIILPRYANHPDFIRWFETEAQIIARLEHPFIVPLYDYWREPDGAYLVMRHLPTSLRDKLRGGPLTLPEALRLLNQIASALAAAHQNGVVHRDLKPANILLDTEGNAYLADFGIAQANPTAMNFAQADRPLDSPGYLSPEQIRSAPVTPSVDIYAFGLVLYEALTGQYPFPGDLSFSQMVHKHLSEPMPSLRETTPDLPSALDTVIQCATAKNPQDRFPDIEALAEAFRAAVEHAPSTLLDPSAAMPVVHERTRMPVELRNPYKGLRPFKEADAKDFFGREALTEHLIARLAEVHELSRFLAIVGPSGSGKSSVVQAGLVPALRNGALPGSQDWFVTEIVPGSRPFDELEVALLRVAARQPASLMEQLRRDQHGLTRAAKLILPEDGELFLVIDQFEEIFITVDDEADKRHFLDLIVAAVTDPRSRVQVVVTLRADFYDRPLMVADFFDLMRQRTEVVGPLTPEEIERAIVGPAGRVGLIVGQGLAAAIIADMSRQPGALPMLQYVLTELFDWREERTLTLDAYHDVGGVLGVIAKRADEVYRALDAEQQADARQLFMRLISLSKDTEDTRHRVLLSELLSVGSVRMQTVINAFDHARLLTFDRDPLTRSPTVEVAHEALLREWGQLRAWLDESRDDIRQQRLLAAAAQEWLNADQDSSYLLRGSRLEGFETWVAETRFTLSQEERGFLHTSSAEQGLRLTKRRRVRNLILAVSVVVTLVMTALALFALESRSTAGKDRDKAERKAAESHSLVLVAAAQQAYAADNPELAIAFALAAANIDDPPAEAYRTLADVGYGPGLRMVFVGHTTSVNAVAVSPDGRYVLSGSGRIAFHLEIPEDNSVRLWDIKTGKVILRFDEHTDSVTDVEFTSDGEKAVSASWDGSVIVWDIENPETEKTNRQLFRFQGHRGHVAEIAISPDARYVLSRAFQTPDNWEAVGMEYENTAGIELILWDLQTGEEIRRFDFEHAERFAMDGPWISPDGSSALVSIIDFVGTTPAEPQRLILFNLATGEIIHTIDEIAYWSSFAMSPDGRTTITDTRVMADISEVPGAMVLWDLASGRLIRSIGKLDDMHKAEISSMTFSPDGHTVLSSSYDGTLILWDVEGGTFLQRLVGHSPILSVTFTPDGQSAVTAELDGTLRLWDLESEGFVRRLRGHTQAVLTVAFSPDGNTALSGGGLTSENTLAGNELILWDLATGDEIRRFEGHTFPVSTLAISPDGSTALSGSTIHRENAANGYMILWDLATGKPIQYFEMEGSDTVSCVAYHPNGRMAISGTQDGLIRLWNLETGEELRAISHHGFMVFGVAYSPDGRTILSGGADGTMILWDAERGEEIRQFDHGGFVVSATYSPDGQTAVSTSTDGRLILWDLATGEALRVLTGHTSAVNDTAFLPDNYHAVSGSADSTLVLWDMDSGEALRSLEGHRDAVRQVAVSPDGTSVLSASRDNTIILWHLEPCSLNDLVKWVRHNRYVREFTCEERTQYRIEPLCE